MDTPSSSSNQADNDSETPQQQVWTVQKILNWTTSHLKANNSDSPRLESEVLLAHARGCERIQLYTDFNKPVDEPTRAKMRQLVQRRTKGEPVAYLVGYREFFSLEFLVQPGVFIPRPETETLVLEALAKLEEIPSPKILELCAGSGCISVSIAVQKPKAIITTVEIDPTAHQITSQNIEKHQVSNSVRLLRGDLFDALPGNFNSEEDRFDLLISNPPYVCTAEILELDRDIQDYEPHLALDGGTDGFDVLKKILAQAPSYLKPNGWCLLEMDPSQIAPCLEMAKTNPNWLQAESKKDTSGLQRCVILQRDA